MSKLSEMTPGLHRTTIALAFLGIAMAVLASLGAMSAPLEQGEPAEQGALSQEQMDDLIEVLEDKEQREQFLERLQTLNQAEQSLDANDPAALSEVLHLDEKVGVLLEKYVDTLEDAGLDRSTSSKAVTIGTALLAVAFIVLLNNWLARFLNRKLAGPRERFHLTRDRFSSLFAMQVWGGLALAALVLVYTLVQIYARQLSGLLPQDLLLGVAETVLAAFLVILLFLVIWELSNAFMEYVSGRREGFHNARVQTLLPLVRNVLLFVLVLLTAMVLLSEVGIDVMPLLAGAGVLGIAVGFGAQTLVKDFLTGFTIIAEDLVHIGDVVTVGGRTGEVTRLTIRKIELRSLEGTVHTVPFSEITVVDNLTKDYSYYMFNVGVAYREDTDEVVSCLTEIDEQMREDQEYQHLILAPLEVLGLDEFGDSAVVIKARTKTRAHAKWQVGREFNRRMKYAFDERNIEIPFPHQTLFIGEEKSGKPQAAARSLLGGDRDAGKEAGGGETGSGEGNGAAEA